MKHLSWDDVWAYLDNELSEDLGSIVVHLEACSDCQEKIRQAKRAHGAIVQAFTVPDDRVEDEYSESQLKTRDTQATEFEAIPRTRSRRWGRQWGTLFAGAAGVAATVALCVTLVSLGHAPSTNGSNGSRTEESTALGVAGPSIETHGGLTTNDGTSTQNEFSGTRIASSAAASIQEASAVSSVKWLPAVTQNFAVQSMDGKPVADASVYLVANGRVVGKGISGTDGVTKPITYTPMVDPVLEPSFTQTPAGGFPQRGTVTVVIERAGYQTLVNYDHWVSPGETGTAAIRLRPQASGQPTVNVLDGGFHQNEVMMYANWVETSVKHHIHGESTLRNQGTLVPVVVSVEDQDRNPLTGATVVLLSNRIESMSVTSSSGESDTMLGVALPDNRVVHPGMLDVPRYVNIVVFKDGYSPWVGFYEPVSGDISNEFHVTLTSISQEQGAQANHVTDARASEPNTPSLTLTQSFIGWVKGQ